MARPRPGATRPAQVGANSCTGPCRLTQPKIAEDSLQDGGSSESTSTTPANRGSPGNPTRAPIASENRARTRPTEGPACCRRLGLRCCPDVAEGGLGGEADLAVGVGGEPVVAVE